MKKLLLIILTAAVVLCGCSDPDTELNGENYDGSYNMISEGTSIHVVEEEPPEEQGVYIPEGMVTAYASKKLDDDLLDIYNTIVEAVRNGEESIPMLRDASDYNPLLNLAAVEQLAFGHVSGRKPGDYDLDTGRFSVDFIYRLTPEEMSRMNRESEAAADEIMLGISEDMTDYEKLKFFHDYLILNCESSKDYEYGNTVYGALVEGKALCEGYSKAFSYLCNRVGIENMIVTGLTNEAHMWNMVKVNGNWYHIDVTWDKPGGTLADMFPDMIMYQYFMVTDSVIENDHRIVTISSPPPQALSTNESYFHKEGFYVADSSDIESVMENAFRKAVAEKSNIAMVKFDTNNLLYSVINDVVDAGENDGDFLKDIIDGISAENNVKLNISWTDFYSKYRILVFIIEYSE
ncbi:MAG: hypothetical protein IJ007_08090 [Oscillospiraceae bacterium]|nr:hypothetical protein [Oscillospiraceae bacterium]